MKLIFVIILFLFIPSYLNADWFFSHKDFDSKRFSKLNQINKNNLNELELFWDFSSGDIYDDLTVQSSPVFTGSKIISKSPAKVFALDPSSGDLIWEYKFEKINGSRGFTYDNTHKTVYVPITLGVIELDAENGKKIRVFESGSTTVPPIIHNGIIFIATLNEGVKAYSLKNQQQEWELSLEKNNYFARIWSGFSFDVESELLFAVTGSSAGVTNWWRKDPNFETSLIAIDIKTGSIKWTFQHIIHDVWDLDLVGPPIILDVEIENNKKIRAVIALSKTGDIIYLNTKNGEPIFKNSYETVRAIKSNAPKEQLSPFQKKFFKPEPIRQINIDPNLDFSKKNLESNYLKNKLRYAKYGTYLPPSLDYDVVMYGIHGGPEWAGGSLDLSEENDPKVIIPYNQDPWIIRLYYYDKLYDYSFRIYTKISNLIKKLNFLKDNNHNNQSELFAWIPWERKDEEKKNNFDKIYSSFPFYPKNKVYLDNCSTCHGITRRGFYEYEGAGDLIYPSLIGIDLTEKFEFIKNYEKVKKLHKDNDIKFNASNQQYEDVLNSFKKYDSFLSRINLLGYLGFWQLLLDENKNPATVPPWGGIAKVNLKNGKIEWQVPFGKNIDEYGNVFNGLKNFGGVLTIGNGITFATGTTDNKIYAFNKKGEVIWNDELPFAGSAPPITIEVNGCQLIIVVATGGRFLGFSENGDKLLAYKLNSCKL